MGAQRGFEASLTAEISRRIGEISTMQHELARQHRILTRAATQLRIGRSSEAVLAEIREQSPDLLQDYCDLRITFTPAPLRPVPRAATSP